ncbi:MAG TPA: acylphosphatase [Verrucomicrobiota bacterium]|nr:acylphosphatase [Verrucomicrobiota bacterium]
MTSVLRRLEVLYSGRVQGVGFRHTARSVATGYDVTGTVRNLGDGRVALVAEGAEPELRAFQAALRESGLGPLIRGEDEHWSAAEGGLQGFRIIP